MINPLLDGGAEINPFTNYISTKRKLINVWLLIKMLPSFRFFFLWERRRAQEMCVCLLLIKTANVK